MSASELIKLVGHKTGDKDVGSMNMDGLTVNVQLLDVKQVFGRVDVLVTPISGKGQRWVRLDGISEALQEYLAKNKEVGK